MEESPLPVAERGPADTLLRVGKAYSMTGPGRIHRAVAIRDGRIIATSSSPDGLDALQGTRTAVVDDPGLVVFPAFNDTHNHQLWASRDLDHVDLASASTVADVVQLLRRRAAETPPGEWIVSSRCWHETHLKEERLPTAGELDTASTEHPICVQRGGHVMVVNSRALAMAGFGRDIPDPDRGTVVRDANGVPTGVLIEPGAVEPVRRLLPQLTTERQVELLARQCAAYNARGIGVVRDPGLFVDEMEPYQRLWEQGRLTTRSRVMFWVMPDAGVEEKLAFIDSWAVRSGYGDDLLKIWGFKYIMDGGAEGAHLCEPYANNPGYHGHAFWEPDEFERLVDRAVSRGWKVGCHAAGDAAVERVLSAYERVLRRRPATPRGTLVIEHALLVNADQRARAVRAGIGITVQHPLLYSLGGNLVRYWGEQRTREVMPVRAWLDEGALVAAGSDCNVSFFDPLLSIWGLVTRGTRTVGVQGPEHAVSRYDALRLYTAAGAALLGESANLGTIEQGRLADLVAFRTDLIECPIDDLPELAPAATLVGGLPVHDPEGLLEAVR
ncbi:amidohydrolase [Nonomuraea sp. NPDC049480]|uniref:amidohydrolase n=1 Tax=Nonomuraea sp. NPDC049480 TaxID=3364353 RepID=UPI003794C3F3